MVFIEKCLYKSLVNELVGWCFDEDGFLLYDVYEYFFFFILYLKKKSINSIVIFWGKNLLNYGNMK